jgi:hypothetical protein
MPPEFQVQAYLVMAAILMLIALWVGVRLIRSAGRAAVPPKPPKPTDAPDVWPEHKLPADYEKKWL